MKKLTEGADIISLFCRLKINSKKDLPVRSSEMGLLIFIDQSDVLPPSLEAARFFKVSKPMIAGLVRSLEKKGYLRKERERQDQRSFALALTEKGRSLVKETSEEYLKSIAVLYNGLGEEDYRKLVQLLDKSNQLLLEKQREE